MGGPPTDKSLYITLCMLSIQAELEIARLPSLPPSLPPSSLPSFLSFFAVPKIIIIKNPARIVT